MTLGLYSASDSNIIKSFAEPKWYFEPEYNTPEVGGIHVDWGFSSNIHVVQQKWEE